MQTIALWYIIPCVVTALKSILKWDSGKLVDFSHEAKACALCPSKRIRTRGNISKGLPRQSLSEFIRTDKNILRGY